MVKYLPLSARQGRGGYASPYVVGAGRYNCLIREPVRSQMDRAIQLKIARRAALAAIVLLAAAYAGVSYLIASGVTAAEREEQHDHPSDYGLRYEDVEFLSRKGDVTLEGWYLPSPCCGPSVIVVHGITSNRSGGEATEMAAQLVKVCFNVLLFDLRGHGSSGGDRITGGIDEAQDVLGAYDYMRSRGIRQRDIVVLGRSMGAGASVLAAAAEPEIGALVLDGTYADVTDLVAFEIGRKTPVPEWAAPVFIPGASLLADMLYGVDLSRLAPERVVELYRLSHPCDPRGGRHAHPDRARHTRPQSGPSRQRAVDHPRHRPRRLVHQFPGGVRGTAWCSTWRRERGRSS